MKTEPQILWIKPKIKTEPEMFTVWVEHRMKTEPEMYTVWIKH